MSPDPKLYTDETIEYPQKWNKYSYVRNSPLVRFDPDGLDDHHIVVKAVWEDLPLNSNVRKIFNEATEYAGEHYYWKEHRAYNNIVRSTWNQFFHGKQAEEITEDMANTFIKGLKGNIEVQRLTQEILKKGGVKKVPAWVAGRSASRLVPNKGAGVGLAMGVLFWILGEARDTQAGEIDWVEERKKAQEEKKNKQTNQGIGESELDYQLRRQCELGNSAACGN